MRATFALPLPWSFRVRSALSLPLAAIRRRPVVACWAASRLVLLLFTAVAARSLAPAALAGQWWHWDALWYVRIAEGGYAGPHAAQATAFFPLYPLLIRLAAPFTFGHALAAALLISNVAALLAALGVARLARDLWPEHPARAVLAAALTLASPLAIFLAAPYADSVLLASVVWALVAARERRWWLAAVCGLAAGLTRVTGALLVLPLLWEFVAAHRDVSLPAGLRGLTVALRLALRGGVAVGAPIMALALYAGYLQARFGDLLLFQHAETTYFLRQPMAPWQSIALAATALADGIAAMDAFHVARQLIDVVPLTVAFAASLATLLAQRVPPATRPVALLTLALALVSIGAPAVDPRFAPRLLLPWASGGRYMLAAVSVPLVLAPWATRNRTRAIALVFGGLALQLVLLAYFFQPDAPYGLV